MSAISYSEQLGVDVSDHITSYLATKPVTLPRWIKMQTLWRGDDEVECKDTVSELRCRKDKGRSKESIFDAPAWL